MVFRAKGTRAQKMLCHDTSVSSSCDKAISGGDIGAIAGMMEGESQKRMLMCVYVCQGACTEIELMGV